jgi:hypothetical protein
MRRLNIVISDEAGERLDEFKKSGGFKSLDNAMDCFLMLDSWQRTEEKRTPDSTGA